MAFYNEVRLIESARLSLDDFEMTFWDLLREGYETALFISLCVIVSVFMFFWFMPWSKIISKIKQTDLYSMYYMTGWFIFISFSFIFVFTMSENVRSAYYFATIIYSIYFSGVFIFYISSRLENGMRFFLSHIGGMIIGACISLIIIKNFL